jgi:hypothetical protein
MAVATAEREGEEVLLLVLVSLIDLSVGDLVTLLLRQQHHNSV